MIVRVKHKIKKLRTEKEIRERLEFCLKSLDIVKAEYNEYVGTMYEERYLPDIIDEWTTIESKITVLKWVLGE